MLQGLSSEQREIIVREASTLLAIHQIAGKKESKRLQSMLSQELATMYQGSLFPIDRFFEACGTIDSNEDGFRELYSYFKRELTPFEILVYWPGRPTRAPIPLYSLRDEDEADVFDELLGGMLQLALDTPLEEALGLELLDEIFAETVPGSIALNTLDLNTLQTRLFQEKGVTLQSIHAYFKLLEAAEDDLGVGIVLPEVSTPAMMPADGLSGDIDDEAIHLILSAMENSELENIIDPDKLSGYLSSELQSMWEEDAYNLQELWEVLKGAPGVTRPMLLEVFLRIEKDNQDHDLPFTYPLDLQAMSPDQKSDFFDKLEAVRIEAQEALKGELEPLPMDAPEVLEVDAEPLPAIPEPPSSGSYKVEPAVDAPAPRPLPDREELADQQARTASGRLPARTQSGRIRTARKINVDDVNEPGKKGFPKWLLALLFLSIVGAGAGYYFLLFSPTPTFEGSQVNSKVLNALPYIQDMRRKGRTLLLIVKPTFFKMQEENREDELRRITKEAKTKLGIRKIYLFNASGQYKSKLEF